MASLCVSGVLGGCSLSMLLIESLSRANTNPMHLITFTTSILAPLYCFWKDPNVLNKRTIPIKEYGIIIVLFFLTNVMNNQSVNYDLPFPLFIIFRSGTLMASVLLTMILQRRVYSWGKIISVFSVTFGIIIFTLSSSNTHPIKRIEHLWIDYLPWPRFVTGIMVQTTCVFISAYLGIRQEMIFGIYGKRPDEMMFFSHIFTLPLFLPVLPGILSAIQSFNQSQESNLLFLSIPNLWLKLILVALFQIVCIRNVYQLTSVVSSLSVNMILALRKFLNLFLSVYVFDNELSFYHWLATAMIIGGTCAFYNTFGQIHQLCLSKVSKKRD